MAQLHSRSVMSDRSIQPALMSRSAQQSTKGSSRRSSPTGRGLRTRCRQLSRAGPECR
jgi:hypothetical protein